MASDLTGPSIAAATAAQSFQTNKNFPNLLAPKSLTGGTSMRKGMGLLSVLMLVVGMTFTGAQPTPA
jgi:hypothetical protein